MHDIYSELKAILRNEYVDIDITKRKLEALREKTRTAGSQFEHFRLACLNNLNNNHAIAIDHANRALKIVETEKDVFLSEQIHTLLGFIAYNRGNYEKAVEHYLAVLKCVQSPRVINNIGSIFSDMGDMHEAYRYYKQAEEAFDDPLNFRLLAIIYSNIAECETAFGHYDAAKHYLELSQAQISTFTKKEGTAYIFNAFGNLAYVQEDYDTAIKYYEMGERYAENEAILVYYRDFILNHARTLLAKGDLDGAKSRIERLFQNSTHFSFDSAIPEIQELLAKIADAKGQLELANTHYKKYIELIKNQEAANLQHRSESIKTAVKFAQLHTQLDTLNKMSRSDVLTGLSNRFALREYMNTWTEINNEHPTIIALFDVDQFKLHNDQFGHAHGDACLVEVAKIIKTNLSSDRGDIFRYGGDEFLVTLVGYDYEEAYSKLEDTRKAIEGLNTTGMIPVVENRTAISCSIGAVTAPSGSNQTFEDLFNIADRALYISKDQGRNCVTILASK
ncbi:tetratricopeptide repeat-containing diguanylate cyclase [Fusibacter ferrireducens]|uniref:Diguanylate cyclase n=1 Tax=Fusibacter ferrireducens TaxID=2785058 RepID=A0ABS0A0Z1_9FIRM|nr:diguanylate cyclase [Fusibacter ferrireducens]MBF4695881.1 diguanylate cyclase [Fusibacter ferrireducens]